MPEERTSVGANVVHSGSASGTPDSQRHTTVSAQSDNGFRCRGFFSVFMFDGKKPKHSMANLREHLEILAPQLSLHALLHTAIVQYH